MLKRIIVYMVLAVMLGVGIMVAPLILTFHPSVTNLIKQTTQKGEEETAPEKTKPTEVTTWEKTTLSQPSFLPLILIIILSLFLAAGISVYVKKEMLKPEISQPQKEPTIWIFI